MLRVRGPVLFGLDWVGCNWAASIFEAGPGTHVPNSKQPQFPTGKIVLSELLQPLNGQRQRKQKQLKLISSHFSPLKFHLNFKTEILYPKLNFIFIWILIFQLVKGTGRFLVQLYEYCIVFENIAKKYCILGDQRPLSRRHSNERHNCHKEIHFTHTSLHILYISTNVLNARIVVELFILNK